MSNTQELAQKVEAARAAYYNATPLMSDAGFDALEEELRKLDPDHWLLKVVGAPPGDAGWPKVRHSIPMGSLNKAQVYQEMAKWSQALGNQELFLTEKLDGISVSLRYLDGHFRQAITRGDGLIGEDITRNVSLMKGVVPTLGKSPFDPFKEWSGHLRGEIVCFKSDHVKYFPGESNPRNTASGTAKRQANPEKCQHLTVLVYQVLPDSGTLPTTKQEELALARAMGFTTPHHAICPDLTRVENIYQRYVATAREKLDYDIDGLVLEVNSVSKAEDLGLLNGRPKGAIAYKFPHDQKETILVDVIWQVGNSGRITPVAVFEPVDLAGAKVTRASLHNVKRFNELQLTRGCRILVSRRNDVIPAVEANLSIS